MGYPFIIAYKGDEIARVNHDAKWSVRWDLALNVRYEPVTAYNKAVIAFATVLLAAKDNFIETPWFESDNNGDKWDKVSKVLDITEKEPPDGEPLGNFSLKKENLAMARINFDGTWSIRWDEVDQVSRLPTDEWRTIAIISFCRLLMAAQYRFLTSPWKEDIEDEDE